MAIDRLTGYDTATGRKEFVATRNVNVGKGLISGTLRGAGGSFGVTSASLVVANGEGKQFSIANQTFVLTASDATNPRVDLVQVSTAGVVSIKDGTAAADPACPVPDSNNIALAVVYVPANSSGSVQDMNGQTATTQAVIIAYYYMNGGLHASRVGVTADPSTTSNTFVDADEMTLPVYFPENGYHYELCWDTIIQETYGVLREGGVIGMEIDGTDKTEAIFARSASFELLVATDIFKYVFFLSIHINELLTQAAHIIQGRWHKDSAGTSIEMRDQQRRIWIYQVAQPETPAGL